MSRETKSSPDKITKKGIELLVSRTFGEHSAVVKVRDDRHSVEVICTHGNDSIQHEVMQLPKKGKSPSSLRDGMYVRVKKGAPWEKELRALVGETLRVYGYPETNEVGEVLYDKYRDSEDPAQVCSISFMK